MKQRGKLAFSNKRKSGKTSLWHSPFHSSEIMNTWVALENLIFSRQLVKSVFEMLSVWRSEECLVITPSGVLLCVLWKNGPLNIGAREVQVQQWADKSEATCLGWVAPPAWRVHKTLACVWFWVKIFRKGKTNKIKTLLCEDCSESWMHEKLFTLFSPSTGDLHNPGFCLERGMTLHLWNLMSLALMLSLWSHSHHPPLHHLWWVWGVLLPEQSANWGGNPDLCSPRTPLHQQVLYMSVGPAKNQTPWKKSLVTY